MSQFFSSVLIFDSLQSQKTSSLMHSLTRDKAADAAEGVKPFVYLVAVTAALGGLIFGYDIGGAGKLLSSLESEYVYTIYFCSSYPSIFLYLRSDFCDGWI